MSCGPLAIRIQLLPESSQSYCRTKLVSPISDFLPLSRPSQHSRQACFPPQGRSFFHRVQVSWQRWKSEGDASAVMSEGVKRNSATHTHVECWPENVFPGYLGRVSWGRYWHWGFRKLAKVRNWPGPWQFAHKGVPVWLL